MEGARGLLLPPGPGRRYPAVATRGHRGGGVRPVPGRVALGAGRRPHLTPPLRRPPRGCRSLLIARLDAAVCHGERGDRPGGAPAGLAVGARPGRRRTCSRLMSVTRRRHSTRRCRWGSSGRRCRRAPPGGWPAWRCTVSPCWHPGTGSTSRQRATYRIQAFSEIQRPVLVHIPATMYGFRRSRDLAGRS